MAVYIVFLHEGLQDLDTQKRQAAQDLSQVMTCAAQQGIHGVTLGTFEEVSCQPPVGFQVADDRFYGITPLELLFDGSCNPSFGTCNPHLQSLLHKCHDLGNRDPRTLPWAACLSTAAPVLVRF